MIKVTTPAGWAADALAAGSCASVAELAAQLDRAAREVAPLRTAALDRAARAEAKASRRLAAAREATDPEKYGDELAWHARASASCSFEHQSALELATLGDALSALARELHRLDRPRRVSLLDRAVRLVFRAASGAARRRGIA